MVRRIGRILLLAALLAAPACSKQGSGSVGDVREQVPVQLALSVGGGGETATKGDASVIHELLGGFGGLTDIRLYPFASTGVVEEDDETLLNANNPALAVAANGLVATSNAHLFSEEKVLTFPQNTASFLVYSKVPHSGDPSDAVAYKHKNGSLVEHGFTSPATPSAIYFSPDAMLSSSSTPQAAEDIADALEAVVFGDPFSITAYYDTDKSTLVSIPWDETIGDDNLRTCYEDLTAGGALMPGSGTNVAAMLTNIYRSVYNYNILNSTQYEVEKNGEIFPAFKEDRITPLTYGDLYNGVKNLILGRFGQLVTAGVIVISDGEAPEVSFVSEALATYPEALGLPSGAAAVRWTPTRYVVPLENGLDGIAPISAYCYPPPLYYYANSTIRTSDDAESVAAAYQAGDKTWNQILTNYYTLGTAISYSCCAVALEEKLQFAVGMLQATVKASADRLLDSEHGVVEVSGTNLPLTGVIVGRQYPLNFDFTPRYLSETESKQYYLYDNQISGIYLHAPEENETLTPFHTLCMETPPGKDVYFTLEFQNNTGSSFHGAEGRILPGHKFYLVGKLEYPESSHGNRVFIQDYVTPVTCTITTLKNAHNAVPDMGIPQLSLGVETEVNWVLSPSTVMFE